MTIDKQTQQNRCNTKDKRHKTKYKEQQTQNKRYKTIDTRQKQQTQDKNNGDKTTTMDPRQRQWTQTTTILETKYSRQETLDTFDLGHLGHRQ